MLWYCTRLAILGLWHSPKSTFLAVVTVALGLSASMTTLTLLYVLSADPLPGISQNLYMAWVDTMPSNPSNRDDYALNGIANSANNQEIKMSDARVLLAEHGALRQAAMADMNVDVSAGSGERKKKDQTILAASSDFIPMFGVRILYGRGWSAAEEVARTPVVVIDSKLAQQLFGTINAVDRNIRIGTKAFRVIGVSAPYEPQPHFYGLASWAFSADSRESLYVPYTAALDANISPVDTGRCDDTDVDKSTTRVDLNHCTWLSYWVQLDTPAQVAGYRLYLARYVEDQKIQNRFTRPAKFQLLGLSDWLTNQNVVPDNVRLNVWLAMSFLLLCMVNVAGLLAAKLFQRNSEIGIRRALGASRNWIFIQHLVEASAVCALGGVLALPLTFLGLWILRQQDQRFTDLARLDPTMFGGLFLLALVVGALVGLLPAWQASAVEPGLQVKNA